MSIFKRSGNNKLPKRQPENAEGDFYSMDGVCTSCGAPEAEAPDLIAHSTKEWGHCYFKRQPQTDGEIECAINAISVSCVAGLRYGGRDEKILKRLYEMGEAHLCDHKPVGNYQLLVWNKVIFKYKGNIKELYDNITTHFSTQGTYPHQRIIDFSTNNHDYFEFTLRWTSGQTGMHFKCRFSLDGFSELSIEREQDGNLVNVRWYAIILNRLLGNDTQAQEITWFDMDGNSYSRDGVY